MRRTLAALVVIGCSAQAPSTDPGLQAPSVAKCADPTLLGYCYPTDVAMSVAQPIADFTFTETGGKTIRLGDYYDPAGKTQTRLLHITVVALWSGASLDEVDFILGSNFPAQILAVRRGKTSSLRRSRSSSSLVVAAQLDAFFDAAAIPLNIDIDTSTMRILDGSVGFDIHLDASILKLLSPG